MKKNLSLITLLLSLFGAVINSSLACDLHETQNSMPNLKKGEMFIVSKDKTFQELMNESMMIMHQSMSEASTNKDPDHDFTTMMIPHHQGAIDMARVLLLYGNDPELKNLALQIITDQQNEINIMNAWLKNHKK